MKDHERNKLVNENLSKMYQLLTMKITTSQFPLSQGGFGDDSPKVPASEINTTKI